MKALVDTYWRAFYQNQGRSFDGRKFEDLIRILLDTSFDGNWEATSVSWDGGKDFIDRSIRGENSWAECKMYKVPLSIRAISNTLVMAIIKDIKRILIFSYSKLNRNTVVHLAEFAESSNRTIQVFDDELLEKLILSSQKALQTYFKEFQLNPAVFNTISKTDEISYSLFFSLDVQVERNDLQGMDGLDKKRYPLIPINTPCLYEIVVRSNSVKPKDIIFNLSELKSLEDKIRIINWKYLGIDCKNNLSINLLPGETKSCKIYLLPINQGEISIPTLKVHGNNFKSRNISQSISTIRVSKLNNPPLIGSDILNGLNDFNTRISAGNIIGCTIVSGRTGVGKSRFLEEAKNRLMAQNYSIRYFDGNCIFHSNFNQFSKSLLSKLWHLPDPARIKWSEESKIENHAQGNEAALDKVLEFIYGEERYYSYDDVEEIVHLATQGMLMERVAILIDNVQALDNLSIRLVSSLIDNTVGHEGQNALVLAFNIDELVFSEAATILYHTMNNRGAKNKDLYNSLNLKEFSYDQVCMFLDSVIVFNKGNLQFSRHYGALTQAIYDNVLPRPLDLFLLLRAAEDESNLRVKNDFFYLEDINGFLSQIRKVQRDTANILEMRISKLLAMDGRLAEEIARTLLFITHIGDFDYKTVTEICHAQESIDFLCQAGFLKIVHDNRLVFFHPSLDRYFSRHILSWKNIYKQHSAFLLSSLEKFGLSNKLPLEVFALNYYNNTATTIDALNAINAVGDIKHFSNISDRWTSSDALNSFLLSPQNQLDPEDYIKIIINVTRSAAESNDLEAFADYLNSYYIKLSKFKCKNNLQAKEYFWFLRQTASYTQSIKGPAKGLDILHFAKKHLDNTSGISEKVRCEILSNLLDRESVCLNLLGKKEEAEEIGLRAHFVAKKGNISDVECLSLIDLGHIFYDFTNNKTKLLYYWRKARDCYLEHNDNIYRSNYAMRYSCQLMLSRLEMIEDNGDFGLVKTILDDLVKDCKINGDIYYLIKGQLMKALLWTFQAIQSKTKIAFENYKNNVFALTMSAEDLSIVSGLETFYRKSIFMQAQMFDICGETEKSTERYLALLNSLRKGNSNKLNSAFEVMLVIDALRFWRRRKKTQPFPISPPELLRLGIPESLIHPDVGTDIPRDYQSIFAINGFNLPTI